MKGIDKFRERFAGHEGEYVLIGGVAVLSVEGLIPFKAKAWLDLSARQAGRQAVDEKNVKKHRNDVCRLATHTFEARESDSALFL